MQLPAVVSTAERLVEPAKVDPEGRAAVAADRITTVTAADLGSGPWGQDGSGTYVGEVRVLDIERAAPAARGLRRRASRRSSAAARGTRRTRRAESATVRSRCRRRAVFGVQRSRSSSSPSARTSPESSSPRPRGSRATSTVMSLRSPRCRTRASAGSPPPVRMRSSTVDGAEVEEDVAAALASWAAEADPWAVLLPSTAWGREVAGRAAARLGAGLTGDAVGLEVSEAVSTGEVQLLAWKPAFGGRLVAAIYCQHADPDGDRSSGCAAISRAPRVRSSDRDLDHHGPCTRPGADHVVEPRRRRRRARDRAMRGLRRCRRAAGRLRGAAAVARRARRTSSPPRARSPTRAGSRAPGKWASPAAASRRACMSASDSPGSSTTRSACAPPERSSRSTPTATRPSGTTRTSASSPSGETSSPASSLVSRSNAGDR